VIGAGPAGAMAACQIARQGHSVLLIDKSAFPRDKVCGCCLSAAALRTLRDGRMGFGDDFSRAELRWMCVAAAGRAATLPLPAGAVVSRADFDAHLVRTAVAAGVDFLPRTCARSTHVQPETRVAAAVCGAEELEMHARVLLVAEGLHGQLLRGDPSLRVRPDARIGMATTLQGERAAYAPRTVYMACGEAGYVGLVRLADGSLHIAAAIDPAVTRQIGVAHAAGSIIQHAGLPVLNTLEDAGWHGTAPLTRIRGQLAAHRMFLLGDAAGYVEPFTGEGIAWALAAGRAVAPLAVAGIRQWSDRSIQQWTALLHRLVRQRQFICRIASGMLRHPKLVCHAIRVLSWAPRLSGPVTSLLNRPYHAGHSPAAEAS
jgi:menaquinone-9 beta-reductase